MVSKLLHQMKFFSGVIDVGFIRSLYKVYFAVPFEKGGFLGNGECTLACGSLALQNTMVFASKLAVQK